ncbi:hypothetical protein JVX88_02220 [Leptolyngbya sp. 7M]|nr:hypothetical protein [Leptolyngbya sp. 7M]QYO68924.1 hypothetical protein JVX88_02220 [Leptolyngbya sp. 7M]
MQDAGKIIEHFPEPLRLDAKDDGRIFPSGNRSRRLGIAPVNLDTVFFFQLFASILARMAGSDPPRLHNTFTKQSRSH